jgi:hypothetical protein
MVRLLLLLTGMPVFIAVLAFSSLQGTGKEEKARYYVLSELVRGVPADKKVSSHVSSATYCFAAFIKIRGDSILLCGTLSTQKIT